MTALLNEWSSTHCADDLSNTDTLPTVDSILSEGAAPLQPVQAEKIARATANFAELAADILMW